MVCTTTCPVASRIVTDLPASCARTMPTTLTSSSGFTDGSFSIGVIGRLNRSSRASDPITSTLAISLAQTSMVIVAVAGSGVAE